MDSLRALHFRLHWSNHNWVPGGLSNHKLAADLVLIEIFLRDEPCVASWCKADERQLVGVDLFLVVPELGLGLEHLTAVLAFERLLARMGPQMIVECGRPAELLFAAWMTAFV